MRILLTKKAMAACDRVTIEQFHMPSAVLMERAALGCVGALYESGADLRRILVVCGSGNNGGDGFAIARLLFLDGRDVSICFAGSDDSCTPETAWQKKICAAYGINFCSNPQISEYTVIVDALFGVGLSRPVTGTYAAWIDKINRSAAFVLSADIPSGIDADTGAVWGCAVRADLTVTFAFEKPGHYLGKGRAYCGRVVLYQMGITKESLPKQESCLFCYDDSDLARLPGREVTAHKGTCGRILLIAGSAEMCGAAVFAAKAALRCGAGMVRILTDACSKPVIQSLLPEAIVTCDAGTKNLEKLFDWADAYAVGPGLGTSAEKLALVTSVLAHGKKPLILDADALNLIAANHLQLSDYPQPVTITPHIGEMARLRGEEPAAILQNLPAHAADFAKIQQVICVLKDAGTVVSNGADVYVNVSGNSGMASAGSGDVLTGILAALAAEGMDAYIGACTGVYLHGRAGDHAARKLGRRSMTASDLIDGISHTLKHLERTYEKIMEKRVTVQRV